MGNTEKKAMPKIQNLEASETFKLLKVHAAGAAEMPEHFATSEALVILQSGDADIFIDGETHHLVSGSHFLIPAQKKHALKTENGMEAHVILQGEGEIKFK